jgi:hypothetical protein
MTEFGREEKNIQVKVVLIWWNKFSQNFEIS